MVFADGVRLGEVGKLLYGLGAEIVGGPSATGVYTLEVGARNAIEQSVLERLRDHAEVVFAEPVSPPPAARRGALRWSSRRGGSAAAPPFRFAAAAAAMLALALAAAGCSTAAPGRRRRRPRRPAAGSR